MTHNWSPITLGTVRARQAAKEQRRLQRSIPRWQKRVLFAVEAFLLYRVLVLDYNILETVACSYLPCGGPILI